MLILSMGVSVDGFIADRSGAIDWTVPSDEQFAFHLQQVSELGAYLCGRRLYETMLVWETDSALSSSDAGAAFAEVWRALPKVVFSTILATVEGNARLASGPLVEEINAALRSTSKHVAIGGATLAAGALQLGLIDELRIFRNPIVVGGGTPLLPSVSEHIRLELLDTRSFGSGVVYERYRRINVQR